MARVTIKRAVQCSLIVAYSGNSGL